MSQTGHGMAPLLAVRAPVMIEASAAALAAFHAVSIPVSSDISSEKLLGSV